MTTHFATPPVFKTVWTQQENSPCETSYNDLWALPIKAAEQAMARKNITIQQAVQEFISLMQLAEAVTKQKQTPSAFIQVDNRKFTVLGLGLNRELYQIFNESNDQVTVTVEKINTLRASGKFEKPWETLNLVSVCKLLGYTE